MDWKFSRVVHICKVRYRKRNMKAKIMYRCVAYAIAAVITAYSPVSGVIPGFVSVAYAGCDDDPSSGVDWSECRKRNLIMTGVDLSGANLLRSDLSSSDLRNSEFTGANFRKSNLVRAALGNSTAVGANFTGIIASRTDFSGGDFSGSSFAKAETSRSDFTGAKLSGADMSKAEFSRARFGGANINEVKFDFTNLARADLRGAEFDVPPTFANAYLFLTRIEGVDLSKASDLNQWQVNLACGDDNTLLPEDIQKPVNWPCEDLEDE